MDAVMPLFEELRNHFLAELRAAHPQLKMHGINLADGYLIGVEHYRDHWCTTPIAHIHIKCDGLELYPARVYDGRYVPSAGICMDWAGYADQHDIDMFKSRLVKNLEKIVKWIDQRDGRA